MQLVHEARPVVPRDRFIDGAEVDRLCCFGKSTRYMLLKEGKFPKPIRYSARKVVWNETAVLQWIQDRIKQGEATGAQS
jgi:prophage regulatory protein